MKHFKRAGRTHPLTAAPKRPADGLEPDTDRITTRVSREVVKSSGCIGYVSSVDKAVHADSEYRMRDKGRVVRWLFTLNGKTIEFNTQPR